MPARISRSQFRERLQNKELKLDDVRQEPQISGEMKTAIARADSNGDGKIKGQAETDQLFRNLDHFDRDGSRHSMHLTDAVSAVLGAVAAPVTGTTGNTGDTGSTGQLGTITRSELVSGLSGKQVKLSDLQLRREIPSEVFSAASKADTNNDGIISGTREASKLFAELDELDRNGDASSMHRTEAHNAILAAATDLPPGVTPSGNAVFGDFTHQTNASALRRAESTDLGGKLADKVTQHKATYQEASALTGVPAEMIAAIHANESGFGDYRPSTHGPESGFGLDDRYVTTRWGNEKLAEHGLGRWERGTNSSKSILQSAVIAAEHLKRNSGYADISIDSTMDQGELAGAALSYIAGPGAARRANRNGSGWMFKPSDSNPHPLHPGGTSRGPNGRTIRVRAARKPGLLRWDVLLPMIQTHIR